MSEYSDSGSKIDSDLGSESGLDSESEMSDTYDETYSRNRSRDPSSDYESQLSSDDDLNRSLRGLSKVTQDHEIKNNDQSNSLKDQTLQRKNNANSSRNL